VLVSIEVVRDRLSAMRVSPLLLVVACAASPNAASRLDRVPNGDWGGQHVRLTVDDTGGRIEFDCAHGRLGAPLTLDGDGRFDVAGSLVSEGGPVPSLAVTLEGGQDAGTFSLVRGGRARLVKCR